MLPLCQEEKGLLASGLCTIYQIKHYLNRNRNPAMLQIPRLTELVIVYFVLCKFKSEAQFKMLNEKHITQYKH